MPDFEAEQPAFAGNAINNPDLSSGLEPRVRAIRSGVEAGKLVKYMIDQHRDRNIKNARIMAKYNSEQPHTQAKLDAEGLGWKSNFSTKPLTILIDKVAPRFRQALDSAKYLTNAKLPDDAPGADRKTEAFRREITQLCRARRGWKTFISSVAQENALFGYDVVAWLDEVTWFPKFFRQDESFFPTGTKQDANSAQVLILKEDFLLHELFDKIKDKEDAKDAGWDLETTIRAINTAMPMDRRSQFADWERVYQDMIRESSICASLESGAKVVTVYSLLVTEIDGKVSHYRLEDRSWEVLFERFERFPSMEHAASFFSFQHGNGTMHGSKGIGREIYSIAGILDRSRNDVVDRLLLAGKMIIQGDERLLKRFRMSLVGNAILIGSAYSVVQNRLDGDVEPFFALDNYLSALLDQIAGAASPKQLQGERVTAAQVNLVASREEEQRDVIMERFLAQFADLMQTLQLRAVDSETIEDDAREMQKRLLQIMNREEMDMLAKSPVASTVSDYSDLKRQQIALIAAENQGNPLINQPEMKRRQLTAQIDEEFANAVMLPENDPTVQAEQQRLQQMELQILTQGQPVPVSPRDDAAIHLATLRPALEAAGQEVMSNPQTQPILEALVAHGNQHLAMAQEQGLDMADFEEDVNLLNQLTAAMAELQKLNEQQAIVEQEAAQLDAEQLPPGI
jgi:hypothetical protein